MNNKFALITLGTILAIRHFATQDEIQDAMIALRKNEINYIPLKYHAGTTTWIPLEVCE